MTQTFILNFLSKHKDIFAEMPPKFDLFVGLQEELESQLKQKIDLVRLRAKMNPRLKENILRDALYV